MKEGTIAGITGVRFLFRNRYWRLAVKCSPSLSGGRELKTACYYSDFDTKSSFTETPESATADFILEKMACDVCDAIAEATFGRI